MVGEKESVSNEKQLKWVVQCVEDGTMSVPEAQQWAQISGDLKQNGNCSICLKSQLY